MKRKLSKKNTKYINSKLSKKNTVYNRTKFSNKNSLCATRKLSKRYKIKGGKPAMPASYTYFIVAHGSYHERLQPIKVPFNSSIITLNELNKLGSSTEVIQLINFYLRHFKLFDRDDQGKQKTTNGEKLIRDVRALDEQQKRVRHQIKVQEARRNGEPPPPTPDFTSNLFTSVRNHVYGDQGFMNDTNITFLPQKSDETQYLGVVRLNNYTDVIEFFDNSILYQLQTIYEKNHQSLRLSSLLNFLFNNKDNETFEFDEHTTIITFMCRSFSKTLSEDDQMLMRTRSSDSDQVPSIYSQKSLALPELNNENMWLSVDTPIKLINGITGTIRNFSLPLQPSPLRTDLKEYQVKLDDPTQQLSINSCVILRNRTNSNEDGQAGIISDLFDSRTNMWPVRLFDGPKINVPQSELVLSPFTIGSCVYSIPSSYEIGTRVRLSNLTSKEYNNKTGKVITNIQSDGRIGVELEPDKSQKKFKPNNLQEILEVTGFNSKTKEWIVKNCINEVKHINHSYLEPCEFQKNELIFYNNKGNDEICKIGDFDINTNVYNIFDYKRELTEDRRKQVIQRIYSNHIKKPLHEILNLQNPIIKKLSDSDKIIYISHSEIMHLKNDSKLAKRFDFNDFFCRETFNSIMKLYNEYREQEDESERRRAAGEIDTAQMYDVSIGTISKEYILDKINEALEGDCQPTFVKKENSIEYNQLTTAQEYLESH